MRGKKGYIYLEASQKIFNKACLLKSIVVTAGTAQNTYADIYDGDSTKDPKVARLRAPKNYSPKYEWPCGLPLERGLYIDFDSDLSSVTVEAEPVK